MAFHVKASMEAVQGYLQAGGYADAQIGEPQAPPTGTNITAAVFMNRAAVVSLYVSGGTREVHVLTVRFYRNAFAEPQGEIEGRLMVAASQFRQDVLADADLGGEIMRVDAAGMDGSAVGDSYGYENVHGVMCRTVDVTLPLIVNDSATVTA